MGMYPYGLLICEVLAEYLSASNNAIFANIVATQPPKDVVEPYGSKAFALNDGAPYQPGKHLSVYEEKTLEARRPSIAD